MDNREFACRNKAGFVLMYCLGNPNLARHEVRPVVGWSAGDDAVVVARKALRLLEPLLSAGRATVPVGKFGAVSVVGGDDCLSLNGHLMDRSISEIHELFGMVQ